VGEICAWIHQHDGLNVIVTHRRVQSTQELLDFHELSSCFDDILSSEQGYPRKPDPTMIFATLEKHNLLPEETFFIGDCDLDIQSGRAAGIHTCLFGILELPTPVDIMINNYDQLLTKLANGHEVNRDPK
jgi:phosphoglycolate phosphatase-like HAD superfamily hydrolase